MKRWTVSRPDEAAVKKITSATDLSSLLAQVMAARGYDTVEKLADFFNGTELSDPFLLADMQNAVEAVNSAVESGELICVYGDYDCDGIMSTAVLYGYLSGIGANVISRIPERDEGYGLNADEIRQMSEDGVSLIITVDNGISAIDESLLIKELGMKLVITDHHRPTETLPEAAAVVDPHRQDCPSTFKHLCGAGVVLKLCAALDGGSYDIVCEQYLDLVAIATVADVVPLIGENRIIVSQGLRLIRNTENEGLLALFEECGVKAENLTAFAVAYTVAPRINAASRFGSPKTALDMLLSEDGSAPDYAKELVRLNAMRKTAEAGIMEEIAAQIDGDPSLLKKRVLIVSGKGWHRGVIGIVAARLVEMYSKPSLVISSDGSGESCGSARSVLGFNVFSCFDYCRELLEKYGGHELAGGLTVSDGKIGELCEKIEEYALLNHPSMPRLTVCADKLLSGADITVENAASLSRIEPCGQMNQEPVFAVSGAKISAIYPLKGGEHTKIDIDYDGANTSALLFRVKTADFILNVGDSIDFMANMSLNEYKGNKSAVLRIIDYRPHGVRQEPFFAAFEVYEKFCRGEKVSREILKKGDPTRSELVGVYKYISGLKTQTDYKSMFAKFSCEGINAFKLAIIIDAFCDTGLLSFCPSSGKVSLNTPKSRVDIDSSETLIKLRKML